MSPITSNQLTMSSREIAELTGKEHKHVKRDVNAMIFQLNFPDRKVVSCPEFNRPNLDGHEVTKSEYRHNGNTYEQYNLSQRYTELLITGYSVTLRLKVIDRLHELESSLKPKIPTNFSEALQLAADQAKQLELAAPKIAFVDNLVTRHNLLNATQVGQPHKLSAVKLNSILDEFGGIYNKSIKRSRAFCQSWIDKGYGEMKVGGTGHNQCLFTVLGEQRINEILLSEGVL